MKVDKVVCKVRHGVVVERICCKRQTEVSGVCMLRDGLLLSGEVVRVASWGFPTERINCVTDLVTITDDGLLLKTVVPVS